MRSTGGVVNASSTCGVPGFDVLRRGSGSDPDGAPIRAAYFRRVRNVGDAVAPCLIEAVTGRQARWVRPGEDAHLLSIGSLLQVSTPQSFVWGTGLLQPGIGVGAPDASRILAVRGKLTYAELVRNGVRLGDVPLGDPGYLVGRLFAGADPGAVRFRLGLAPHYVDRAHPFFAEAAKHPDVKVLDVGDPAEVFFAHMAACDAIASTSLHGLIFAEALGLPSLWLEASDRVLGAGFKFADWFSTCKAPQTAPVHVERFASPSGIAAHCEPREAAIDAEALVAALRPDVVEACSERLDPRRRFLPNAACRARALPVFIVSNDDAEGLQQVVAACRRQRRAIELVVFDVRSDEAPMPKTLLDLQRDGITVLRKPPGRSADLHAMINAVVERFFRRWAEPSRYVLADCRRDIAWMGPDALDLYDDLLDRLPRADRVGPHASRRRQDAGQDILVHARPAGGGVSQLHPYRCRMRDSAPDLAFAVYRAGGRLEPVMRTVQVE